MAKFKVGDIAVCIESCTGISECGTIIHNSPPKKGEEFPVIRLSYMGNIQLAGVSDAPDGHGCAWDKNKFKHKTNDLFESKIDQIEKSMTESKQLEKQI